MSLTHAQCANAQPTLKPYKLFDDEGLYLHVMPNGKRFWRYKYRFHGKERTIALGKYPAVSIEDARKKKNEAQENISKGIDPLVLKYEQEMLATFNNAQTFELIAREWHQRNYTSWAERHAKCILFRLDTYLFSRIGNLPITSLTPQMLLSCLQKIENTSPDTARRLIQYCRRVFEYAVVTGRLDRDLTFGLLGVMKKPKKGHMAAIEIDELPELLKKMNSDEERAYRQTHLAMRLMLLTFVRTKELLHARWTEIDFERAMWTIPAERMKMKLQHLVPLSRQALAILAELREINGHREYIFPSIIRWTNPISTNAILDALERMGYKGKMTGHGFRSLAMGIIKERLEYRHEVIDRQLSHVPRSEVDRAYDRSKFLSQRIKMMQEYADYIDSLQNNKQPQERKNNDRTTNPNTYGITHRLFANTGSTCFIGEYKPVNTMQRDQGGALPQTLQNQPQIKWLDDGGYKGIYRQ